MAGQDNVKEFIRACFKELDTNKDGVICKAEIGQLLNRMFGAKVPTKVVDTVMEVADKDGSGNINSLEELEDAICSIEIIVIAAELAAVFRKLDVDGSGTLTRDEIKSGWSKVSSEPRADEIKDLIERADTDGDGKINCGEFVVFIIDEMFK